MKKISKTIVKIVLIGLLILPVVQTEVYNINANENNTNNTEEEISENFINYYTSAFSDYKNVKVTDSSGNDITAKFYIDNIDSYNRKDFYSIKMYINDNVSETYIDESNINIEKLKTTRSPFVSCPVSKRYYQVLRKGQASGEIEYYIQGSFVWDRATGRITSISGASFKITHLTFGASWGKSTTNMSTRSYITSSNTVANFTGSFNVVATYVYNFVPTYNETFYCSGSVSSYPFG